MSRLTISFWLSLVAVLLFGLADMAYGGESYGPYRADVISVYDGDTFTANIHIFPGLTYRRAVRVAGIDTPEIRGKCDEEKRLAFVAKAAAETLLGTGAVTLHTVIEGKYAGRVVATVTTFDGVDLGAELVSQGLAVAYDGTGPRRSWCPDVETMP